MRLRWCAPTQASMPTRQGGMLANRISTWLRDHLCRSTTAPRRSRPMTWNEVLPISIPTTAISGMTFSDMACSFVQGAPVEDYAPAGQEHGRTIPLTDIGVDRMTYRRYARRHASIRRADSPDA